jgi:hypothetical protein
MDWDMDAVDLQREERMPYVPETFSAYRCEA